MLPRQVRIRLSAAPEKFFYEQYQPVASILEDICAGSRSASTYICEQDGNAAMTIKIENMLNKGRWEASRRPQRSSGVITDEYQEALNAHIAGDFAQAIALARLVPGWRQHPAAHRIIGLAEEGKGNADAAIKAHMTARDLNAGHSEAQAGDEINLASAWVALGETDSALDAYKRAFFLEPNWLAAPLGIISVLNRQGRRAELHQFLAELMAADPNVANNVVFLDHLKNDTDFIGVEALVDQIKAEKEKNS